MSSDIKIKVQSFGRFLSNMVMPNIGAFIAWGIITALFIPTGWLPNETLAKLVGPMITYLLPLLIGYTGGKLVGGERGGVVGAITTMGVIVGADMPMFLGSMIAGPLGGWCIKHFDRWVDGKIKSGFEMLVNNFSAGIIGMILAILAFLGIGPVVEALSKMLAAGVNFMVVHDMLPLASIFVEPAKILFLNNAINHGIFSPLGIQQSHELGKSIFFLIEANPGPGMGVLLAYMFFGRGSAKQSAGGAAIIHFLGGIHEIYFPYVLMNPRLILAVILGGMTGVFTLTILGGGLVSPASPGSILAVLAMTPKGAYFIHAGGVCQTLDDGLIIQCIGQAGDNLNVLVVTGSNTNHQTGNVIFFFTEAHAFRVLAEHDARFQYAIFRFNRTVWHRDRLTQISRGQFFTIQHRLNVFRLNVTAFHQLLASKTNRFFFGCRFATEEDVLRA